MRLPGPILVAADLSEGAGTALRQGHEIAASIRERLVLCHVLPEAFRVRMLFPHQAGVDTVTQAALEEKARRAIAERAEAVLGFDAASLPIEVEIGTPHSGILMIADRIGAGMIVVGDGSAALRVARSAVVPVLIARPAPPGGGVLAATDLSDPSFPAIRAGAEEARRRGVRFRAVHCLNISDAATQQTPMLPGTIGITPLPQAVIQQLQASARERLGQVLATTDVVSEGLVRLAPPVTGVLEAAQAAPTALIVVGARGRSALSRLAFGSVAEEVIRRAECSVLVVRLHPV